MTTTPTATRTKLPNQSTDFGYLTTEEIEWIITKSKELTKGHKRDKGTPWFWVRVDGQSININRTNDLKSLLGTCYIVRSEFEMFRNFMKGITINLDK
jgi:hypothetical protein